MHVVVETEVAIARARVWDYVSDPARAVEYLHGLTTWQREGGARAGLGARFRLHVRIGGIELGELLEIVEFDRPADVAWRAVRGVDLRWRWRLRAVGPDRTRVELRLAYHVAGGVMALLAAWVAEPIVRRKLEASLAELKRRLEVPAPPAAARRAAGVTASSVVRLAG